MIAYPVDALYEEAAYIAYHFHWDRDTILDLSHLERRRWVEEIAAINRRLAEHTQEGEGTWS
jgi:hypothetical protein